MTGPEECSVSVKATSILAAAASLYEGYNNNRFETCLVSKADLLQAYSLSPQTLK